MASKTQANRLSGPDVLEVDPNTGRILDDENFDASGLESDQDRLLDDIIGEFSGGDEEISYSASVTRIPKNFTKGQKEPWLFECDAADIIGMRSKLRDIYRGGQFRIRVYKTGARGKRLHRQMDYFIEAPDTVSKVTGDNKIDALSAAFERTQELLLTMTERLSQGPATAPAIAQPDPFLMMERMSVIMKNMQPAHAAMPADNSFSMKDGMELFTKGMELAENMRGDGGDSWISVFKEMAKQLPVADILKNLADMQQQRPQQRQLAAPMQNQQRQPMHQNRDGQFPGPRPPVAPQNIVPANPAQTGEQLQQSMAYLIGRARRNSDPALYAEWLFDNTDRSLIRQMANDPNVLDQLAVIFPALNQPNIRQWFGELVEAVKEALADMPETGDIEPGIGDTTMQQPDAGAAGHSDAHSGRDPWDQGNPQDHARLGENGPA